MTKGGAFTLLMRDRSTRIGLIIVAIFSLSALGASFLAPFSPYDHDLTMTLKPPSILHPLGTDLYGRDLLSRLIYGARVSLGISLSAAAIAVAFGTSIGLAAGFLGGWTDQVLMRLVDVFLGFPRLFAVLLAVGFGSPSIWLTVAVLGLLSWMEVARIVRGEVLVIKEMLYLKSAIALGLGRFRIMIGYILPNVIGPVVVSTTLLIGTMILVEASLSFLGLGVQPPQASWGNILNQGRLNPVEAWWISTFAGIAIVVLVVGFNLLGDGLRDLLDPKSLTSSIRS